MATDAKGSIASSPLELTLGSIVTDNISSSNDVDYFKLPQVTSASKLTLDFTGLSSTTNDNEFIISVKNASDTTVATTTKGLSTTLNAAIAADSNYYIRVEKGTNFSSSNYSLKAYLTPTVETEDNGIPLEKFTLPSTGSIIILFLNSFLSIYGYISSIGVSQPMIFGL